MAKSSSMPVVSPKTAAPVAEARRYLQAGQFGPAEALMRQVLSTYPDDPEACQVLGLVYYQMGRPQDACPLLEKSVRIAPNVVVNRINLGAVLQALGRHADSVEQFRFAAIKDPSNVLAHSNLGYAYRETGDLLAALDAFSRAQSLQPGHVGSH